MIKLIGLVVGWVAAGMLTHFAYMFYVDKHEARDPIVNMSFAETAWNVGFWPLTMIEMTNRVARALVCAWAERWGL